MKSRAVSNVEVYGYETLLSILRKNWFFLGIFLVVSFGISFPMVGHSLKLCNKPLIFTAMLVLGIRQKFTSFMASVKDYHCILFCLFNSFVLMPLLGLSLGKIFFSADGPMFIGIVIASAGSTTLISAIVWTHLTKGNEALSMVLVIFSSLVSVFITPFIIELSVGADIEIPLFRMINDLFMIILLPVVISQMIRHLVKVDYDDIEKISKTMGHVIILSLILILVSTAKEISLKGVFYTLIPVTIQYSSVSLWSYRVSRTFTDRENAIANMYCSSQKTLTTAVLISMTYFDPMTSFYILVYHLFQQITGQFTAKILTKSDET